MTDWTSLRGIFEAAIEKFGVINAVLSNAGMNHENLLKEDFDSAGQLKEPDLKCLEVNLIAHVYVAKLALHFFKRGPKGPRQIVFTASAASYIESPPLYQYGAAKTGLVGLMRALRPTVQTWNVSINIVAPWMTRMFSKPLEFNCDLYET